MQDLHAERERKKAARQDGQERPWRTRAGVMVAGPQNRVSDVQAHNSPWAGHVRATFLP